ncbi:jupiter microtubule associated homolog 1 isoform X2 [Esox lucius]|uniref:jupiter microtubule associated homolog 1 isoform X2 n=1 Tax=Esox lucius TaxID=8010 RepID=UPI0014775F8A|nr:jupiter microtubule associated homolog 1 isoform X2 [Esox lucius]
MSSHDADCICPIKYWNGVAVWRESHPLCNCSGIPAGLKSAAGQHGTLQALGVRCSQGRGEIGSIQLPDSQGTGSGETVGGQREGRLGSRAARVLRPPGGASNISFGTDETPPVRKNKMASNIFAEPDDPHAHRRSNPPGGTAKGTLCGEPSAPLRRCQQPLLFPKNSDTNEVITSINIPAGVEGCEQANNDCAEEAEEEKKEDAPQPSAPSGEAANPTGPAPYGRRNPPGGKSSLILG